MPQRPADEGLLERGEVRASFEAAGLSIAEWSRQHGFSAGLVYHILSGRNKGTRGQSHRIAVALRLKSGTVDGTLRLPKPGPENRYVDD